MSRKFFHAPPPERARPLLDRMRRPLSSWGRDGDGRTKGVHMVRTRTMLVAVVASSLLTALVVAGVGSASTTPTSFNGCESHAGKISSITTSHRLDCDHGKVVVSWNAVGPTGSQGTPGVPGAKGATGSPGGNNDQGVLTSTYQQFGNTVTLPANASFEVVGTVYLSNNNATDTVVVACTILSPGAPFLSGWSSGEVTLQPQATGTLSVAGTLSEGGSGGTISLLCERASGGPTTVVVGGLVVTKVGSLEVF